MSSYAYANSHAMKISTYFHLFTPDVDRVALVRQMPFRNYNVQLHFDGEILPAKIYYDKEKSCPEGTDECMTQIAIYDPPYWKS